MTQAVVNGYFNRNGVTPNLFLLGAAYASLRDVTTRTRKAAVRSELWLRSRPSAPLAVTSES